MTNRKKAGLAALILMLVAGWLVLIGHRGKSPAGELSTSAHSAAETAGTTSGDASRMARASSREKASILKELEQTLQDREAQRVIKKSDAEYDLWVHKDPKGKTDERVVKRRVSKYAVVRAPSETERAEIDELIRAALHPLSAADADEIRAGLEKTYLNYPKAFKLLSSSRNTDSLNPRSIWLSVRNVDGYHTTDAISGQKLEGPPEHYPDGQPEDPEAVTESSPGVKTRFGYLLGARD